MNTMNEAAQAADNSIRHNWALPVLTGSIDDTADRRTMALAMALSQGLDGTEAVDVAIAATAPELLVLSQNAALGESAAREAATDAAYPMPDTPHASVSSRAIDNRTAFGIGWQARAGLALGHPAELARVPSSQLELELKLRSGPRFRCQASDCRAFHDSPGQWDSCPSCGRKGYLCGAFKVDRQSPLWNAWEQRTIAAYRSAHQPAAAPLSQPATQEPFQSRVQPWVLECFGAEIAADKVERNHRFLEEAIELAQACNCTASEAHQLVDYVFGRPVGEPGQEVGGVMVTLAALCLAHGMDMATAGETELARIWTKSEAIRAKQAAKPKYSPLPAAPAPATLSDCAACGGKGWGGSGTRCGSCNGTGKTDGMWVAKNGGTPALAAAGNAP